MDAELLIMDEKDFERIMSKFVQQEMYYAVREFLKACLIRIPVDTGFLRGSFQDILTFYRVKGISYSGRDYNPPKRYFHTPGFGIVKTPESGRQFVTKPTDVIQQTGPFSAAFEIDNMIKYFTENDQTAKVRGAPWYSVQAGIEAANKYLEGYAKRFPKIELLLTKYKVSVHDQSVTKTTDKPNLDAVLAQGELLIER